MPDEFGPFWTRANQVHRGDADSRVLMRPGASHHWWMKIGLLLFIYINQCDLAEEVGFEPTHYIRADARGPWDRIPTPNRTRR